jgi:hypothetical protein
MAYIDKDKLIRDLIDNRSFYPVIVKNAIENAPIEDVVPRSEVERVINEIADLMWQGWDGRLRIPLDNIFYSKQEFIAYLKKKYIGE